MNKKKITAVIVTLAVLAGLVLVFMWGGNAPGLSGIPKNDTVENGGQSTHAQHREPIGADSVITDTELTCTLSVRCDTVLENLDWLDTKKHELVPDDGVIFAEREVVFYEGESVLDLLLREMKQNDIHMEFSNTPVYNSAYIEGIGNLYEFDCGDLSGWMYRVNGWFPNYGCSRYGLRQGDRVEWLYTCELGNDIGGGYSEGFDRTEEVYE
ncbi:MAG: DUF4430 domain-containing protein [Clostridia bacterium]|nr:DUF4430 domain-containing protein [Clostridia bacterium]